LQDCIDRVRTLRPDVNINQLSFTFDQNSAFIDVAPITGSNIYVGSSILGISSNTYTSTKTSLQIVFPYSMNADYTSSLSNLEYTGTITMENIISAIKTKFSDVDVSQINFEIINNRFVKAVANSNSANYIGYSYLGINTNTWDNLIPVNMTSSTTNSQGVTGYVITQSSIYKNSSNTYGPG
jgi:hypothetical protein